MDTFLSETFKQYQEVARLLGKYEEISINDLANNYCKATDEHNEVERDKYFCALVLRFWYKINKIYINNQTLNIDREEVFSWVQSAIMMVCEPDKRVWQKDSRLNAQQVINQTIATRFVAAAYYDSNLKKNQGKQNALSLDAVINDEDDGTTLGDLVAVSNDTSSEEELVAINLIQNYINKNKLVEAIILDNIAFKDVFKYKKQVVKDINSAGEEYKYTEGNSTFWPFKLVKELSALDESYVDYFINTYKVSKLAFEAAFNLIVKANNQKKYRLISKCLNTAKLNFSFT